MSEKKFDEPTIVGGEKDVDYAVGDVHDSNRRKSSVVNPDVLTGQLFDERYETTQRGLKSRYILTHLSIRPMSNQTTTDTRR
jgi:amino acid transporter